jgi:hypothetical protein
MSGTMTNQTQIDAPLWQRVREWEENGRASAADSEALKAQVTALTERLGALETENSALKDGLAQVHGMLSKIALSAKHEGYYQRLLESKLGGTHLTIKGVGITDVTTEDAHVEIKRWRMADQVMGQLARYQLAVPRPRSCAYFFGARPSKEKVVAVEKLMSAAGIEMYSFGDDDGIIDHTDDALDPIMARAKHNVCTFMRENMEQHDDQNVLLPWTDLRDAFVQRFGDLPPHDKSQGRKAWSLFTDHGLRYVDSTLAIVQRSKFRGFRGWSLRANPPPAEK